MDSRYKLRPDGRQTRLCKGADDTCMKESKKGGLCTSCTSGRDMSQFKNRVDGEIFIANDIRYKRVGGQSKQLCRGDDNTCTHLRCDGGNLCVGHKNGTVRTSNANLQKGDIMVLNGIRYKYNGLQKTQLCDEVLADGSLCMQSRIRDGKCKTHCMHYQCKFTGAPCKRIQTFGDYCALHRNNIQRVKEKSTGEK